MSDLNRRMFVATAGAVAAATIGRVCSVFADDPPGAPKTGDVPADPVAQLNMRFRELYAANRDESNPQDWQNCLVGVCGVGFARRDNIEIAAAMSVMGREAVGKRLLYFENAFTIDAGAAQVASSLADRDLGRDVFGDPYRMWRDLLGDVAIKHAGGSFFPETGGSGVS